MVSFGSCWLYYQLAALHFCCNQKDSPTFVLDEFTVLGAIGQVNYEYSVDHDIYGPLIITGFVDEKVDEKTHVSGYVIIVPGADTRDAPLIKASVIETNVVEVTLVAARHGFFNSAQDWLGSLDKVKKKYNAVKLFKTLKALLTRIKRNSKTKKPVLKIRITFPDEISNQYFSPGAPEGVATMLPIQQED